MKNNLLQESKSILRVLILLAFLIESSTFLPAQAPSSPPFHAATGSEPVWRNAPIGTDTFLLIGMAIAHAGLKVVNQREELQI